MIKPVSNRINIFDPIENLAPRPWFSGASFHENLWRIGWVNQRGGRLAQRPVSISFEEPIAPWPNFSRLCDPGHEHDLLTAKLLIYHSLEPAPVGWLKAPSSVPGVHRRYLNLVRYRHVIGAAGNTALTASHYRDVEARLLRGGVGELLGITERAGRLVKGYEDGDLEVEFGERGVFFGAHIDALLGLSINQLNPSAYAVLKAFCDRRGYRFQRVERKLSKDIEPVARKTTGDAHRKVWTALWDFRSIMSHDPISFKAPPLGQGWNVEERRTPDAPAFQTSFLVNKALSLILDDVITEIIEVAVNLGFACGEEDLHLRAIERINERLRQLGFDTVIAAYKHTRWKAGDSHSLRTFIFVILVIACVIVLANFSARRDSELASLRPDCLSSDGYGELWLECFITKNQNHSVKLPATATIQKAVNVLNKIGEAVSVFGSREWLVEFFDASGSVGFSTNEALELFASSCKVPSLPDGSFWRFTSNQFRKFFATTHQWRHFFPDLAALNHQLQQRDMSTTIAYTKMQHAAALRLNDTRQTRKLSDISLKNALERGYDLREAELQFMKELILAVYRGEIFAAGKGAVIFKEFKEAVARQVDIASSSEEAELNNVLERFVAGRTLTTHPEGCNLCKLGTSVVDKRVAECWKAAVENGCRFEDADGANYAYATRDACFKCVNGIRISALLPYWDAAHDQALEALASDDPFVRGVAEDSLAIIAQARSEFR